MNYIQLCLLLFVLSLKFTLSEDTTTDTTPSLTTTVVENTGGSSSVSGSLTAIAVAPNTQSTVTRKDTTLTTTTDDLVQVTLQRQTTTSQQQQQQSESSGTRTNLVILLTSEPVFKTTENDEDRSLFKLLFTVPSNDVFYNADFKFGQDQEVQLRLDLIQPEIWVMNNQEFLDCNSVNQWLSLKLSDLSYTATGEGVPAQISTAAEYTSKCGYYGLYSSLDSDMPLATNAIAASNYESYRVPYMDGVSASGEFVTDDLVFNLANGDYYVMPNFTFLDANDANVYIGGLGLAGTPKGSGFLYDLTDQNIINSPGYSLWFNNASDSDNALAHLIPGAVNTKYFVGDLYQFDITPHRGYRFNASQQSSNQDLIELTLPVIELEDILVLNLNSGQSLSIKSTSSSLPVLLDSRSSFFYLPLDIIVNLAIQTNAYYSSQLSRWLVKCQPLIDALATIEFVIGNLTVNVPITELITDAVYNGSALNFESGDKACFLRVLPSSVVGYNSIGLPFLKYVYLVVDNEGGKIGLANLNKFLQVNKEDYQDNSSILYNQTITTRQGRTTSNSTTSGDGGGGSIGYITSGTIPFATINSNESEDDGTLSYSAVSRVSGDNVILHIPARLSGAIVSGGSIYITGEAADLTTTSALNASAADASSRGHAPRFQEGVIVDIGGFKIQSKIIPMLMTIGLILLALL